MNKACNDKDGMSKPEKNVKTRQTSPLWLAMTYAALGSNIFRTGSSTPLNRLSFAPNLYPFDYPHSIFFYRSQESGCLYTLGGFFGVERCPPEFTTCLNPISEYLFGVDKGLFSNITYQNHLLFNSEAESITHEDAANSDVVYNQPKQNEYLKMDLPWEVVRIERIHKEIWVLLQFCIDSPRPEDKNRQHLEHHFNRLTHEAKTRWESAARNFRSKYDANLFYPLLNYFPLDLIIALTSIMGLIHYADKIDPGFWENINILEGRFDRWSQNVNTSELRFFRNSRVPNSTLPTKQTDRGIDLIFRSSRHARLMAIEYDETEIPKEYLCPVSQNIMERPIRMTDGHCYDEQSITQLFNGKQSVVSPMTRQPMAFEGKMDLELNRSIENFVRAQEVPDPAAEVAALTPAG